MSSFHEVRARARARARANDARSPYSRSVRLLPLCLGLFVAACDANAPSDAPDPSWLGADAPIALTPSASPVADLDPSVQFMSTVPYGDDPQQVFDAFLPASATPTPAVLYVHGGGFTQGTRTDVYGGSGAAIKAVVAAGVAFIGVDYRLLLELDIETVGVRKSLLDSRRALQFIRFHAKELNIDPHRIGIYGGSAGAGTSVWLAFHDEMAQRENPDRVARQSTRVQAVSAVATQATYDVIRWAEDVFAPEYAYVSNDLLLSNAAAVDLLLQFYGLPISYRMDLDGLLALVYGDEFAAGRADLDMLALASSDDPPIYIVTTGDDDSPLAMGFDLLHHPLHAKAMYEAAIAAGMDEVEADIPAYAIDSPYSSATDFLLDHL